MGIAAHSAYDVFSWYKKPSVILVFPTPRFMEWEFFLNILFPDHCRLEPFCNRKHMKKTFFSEPAKSKARIFSMQQCYIMIYIDTANDAPGVQNGPTAWDISILILTIEKHTKIFS